MCQVILTYQSAFAEPPWNETWSDKEIIFDLEFALSQKNPIVLVANIDKNILGFTWGYDLPIEKFPFLEGKISRKTNYMDEIAVTGNSRLKGIGKLLGQNYLEYLKKQGSNECVLRTDERNLASMTLFKRLCFVPVLDNNKPIYDPEYKSRIYLKNKLGGKNGN